MRRLSCTDVSTAHRNLRRRSREAVPIRSGQALSTMIVIPQIGLPLLLV